MFPARRHITAPPAGRRPQSLGRKCGLRRAGVTVRSRLVSMNASGFKDYVTHAIKFWERWRLAYNLVTDPRPS